MRTPINSDAEIIEMGIALSATRGTTVPAWEIYKELGSRGKLSRFRDLWEAHCAQEVMEKASDPILPEHVQAELDAKLTAFGVEIQKVAAGMAVSQTEQHVRQLGYQHRDFVLMKTEHAAEVQRLLAEIDYLTSRVEELEQSEDVIAASDQDAEQSALQAPAPVAVPPQAVRRSLNRPLKNTRRVQNKVARPALRTRQVERPEEQSRS
jgi:hypothetical protein